MLKKIVVPFVFLFSVGSSTATFACSRATATNSAEFCSSFKTAAQCYCSNSGVPTRMCQDMNIIYQRMIAVFRDVKKACEFQTETTPQDCMDAWHCYREGGLNAHNEPCSGTGAACV